MLRERSIVDIIDNSGAVKVRLFSVTGKNRNKSVGAGNIARGSVIKAIPGGKVKKGEIVSVLIVATKFKIQRADQSSIRASKNCGVVINKSNLEPIGTRILAPIFREIKDLGIYNKVVSQAPEVL